LVIVGQISTGALVLVGFAWIPLMKLISGQLYQYLQSVQAYIAPPVAAVFLVGVFWQRVNARGALVALFAGFVLGMGRLVLELNKTALAQGWLFALADMNFLHFAIFLFGVCSALLVLVSLTTSAMPASRLAELTYATTDHGEIEEADASRSYRMQIGLSLGVALLVGLIWAYFGGWSGR
jgi:SSS family solute:Na+ symporter